MLLYLTLAFQAFCIYHAIKNRKPYYWIFIILFLSVIGCVIYLVTQVYNKRDASIIQERVTNILVPTKKVKALEKQLEFLDTYQNKVNLADAYFEMKDFYKAIKLYEDAAKDENQNNYYIKAQLVMAHYQTGYYEAAIAYAKTLQEHSEFEKSKAQFTYGLALEKIGRLDAAEAQLKKIDQRYDNYEERLVLAQFFLEREKIEEGKDILIEISEESKHMTKMNKQKYRTTVNEVEKLLKTL
ncbi:hypothetical protein N7U66_07730 [Lacinutrix neustonica]|uniref:Tetratricopeptide repeat protein n=1 Tax=Lacinutrix neustonica TaxID=2980107 RepID=A0A9E8N018_9FLAO|nr:hypothetical protein [Lacinutrix neustonica]WAC03404.1 hypothetical protein N7U66_07730 [Lacinutrix neustonica]